MTILEKFYNNKVASFYLKLTEIAARIALPALILIIRIWMARIFWYSGLTKINNMDNTIYLFKYEYKVPFIPAELAAYLTMFTEVSMPIFLVLGFGARLATLPLLIMTAIIEFTYLSLPEHTYWTFLLCIIAFYGPGRFSLDNFLYEKIKIHH